MAKFIANSSILGECFAGWHSGCIQPGVGATKEQAIEAYLEQVRLRIADGITFHVEIADGIVLPEGVADKMPKELPAGCSLVVVVHNDNEHQGDYGWSFFAVPRGGAAIMKSRRKSRRIEKPIEELFFDNEELSCQLPAGSFAYDDGAWKPATIC